MMNLEARTEIHEAWTNLALTESLIDQSRFSEARDALLDAEFHRDNAKESIEKVDVTVSRLDELGDMITCLRALIISEQSRTSRSAGGATRSFSAQ